MALAVQEPSDAGSVDTATTVVNDGTSTITLDPRNTFNSRWWWYYATITGTNGRTLTLDIERDDSLNTMLTSVRHGCWAYSLDGPWNSWDATSFITTPNRVRYEKTVAFTQDTIHVAYYPVCTWAQVEADITTWKANQYVQATTSADANLVVGTTAERSNGYGRTCPQANLYGFKIEDLNEVGSKNTALLVGGNHCGEHAARWAFRDAINLLVSDDPKAAFLRKHWKFIVYPAVNPQGLYGGLYRNAPDALVSDYNRIWGGSSSGTQVTVRGAIAADAPTVHAMFDLHCYNLDYGQNSDFLDIGLVFGPNDRQHPAWQTRMRSYDAAWNWVDWDIVNPGVTGTFSQWVASNLDVGNSLKVCSVVECGATVNYNQPEYRRYGRRVVYALADATEHGLFPVQAYHSYPQRREVYSGYRAS